MRSKGFEAVRTRARRNARRSAAGRLGLLALLLALAAPALFYAVARAQEEMRPYAAKAQAKPQAPVQTKPAAPEAIRSARVRPASVTKVNFKQLAELAKRARVPPTSAPTLRAAPVPGRIKEMPAGKSVAPAAPPSSSAGGYVMGGPAQALGQDDTGGPLAASPSPSQSFLAQEDGPKVGSGTYIIPPDTNGAVGIDRVFTNTNSNYRIHDKATGAPLSTVSTDTFWASSGGSNFFDPQIQFDPYNRRWILAITSNPSSAGSSVNVAVSQTSDPAGGYYVFRFPVGCAPGAADCAPGGEWADFPMLGFNKNWIAVGMNMFDLAGTEHNDDKMLVLDYPSARAGAAVATVFGGLGIGFCNHPVTTYSATEGTLYTVRHIGSADASYQTYAITGTPAAPSLTAG
ncbi:MAG TPA: hypothetical protein VF570_15005, partial [Pyrinomonadaceae bacterium]